jgi:hypothetical protein
MALMVPVDTLRHVHDCCGKISRLVGVLGCDRSGLRYSPAVLQVCRNAPDMTLRDMR